MLPHRDLHDNPYFRKYCDDCKRTYRKEFNRLRTKQYREKKKLTYQEEQKEWAEAKRNVL